MVPEGWSEKKLGSVLERIAVPVTLEPDSLYREIGIRSHGKGIFHKESVPGKTLGSKRVFTVFPDCFVVNIVFAWEQAVAKTTEKEIGFIASHRFPMYKPIERKCDVDFINYFFKTKKGKYLLELASPGGAGRNKTLGQKEFANLMVTMPEREEQTKIAQILSTWDKAIAITEKLINNSKAQKKALMQQLLTGKKRLSGFVGIWKQGELTKYCSVNTGAKDLKDKIDDGEYPFFVRSQNIERINSYSFDGEAILTPGDGKVGEIFHYINGKFDFHQRVYKISDFTGTEGKYVYYYLEHNFKAEVKKHSARATVDSLRMPVFTGMKIKIPSIREQKKIASVLTATDIEIRALQRKRSCLELEKRALMQQLLTGKRRVKVESVEQAHA